MGYVALFRKGSRKVELDGTILKLGQDFVPPAVSTTPLTATGTAANARQGGVKRGETANNRTLSFTVIADGSTETHNRMLLHPLISLLTEAGDEGEPLYFEYRGNNDVSFEPVWGQYGANLRYEIVHANAVETWDRYFVGTTREQAVLYRLTMTIKPYQIGKTQRLGSAIGGILEDVIGTADGRSRGLQIPGAVTNKMTNPVFGHATFGNGWTADASLVASENTDPEFLIPGTFSSAKLTALNTGQEYYQSINVGNTNAHVLSCYAKLPDGGALSSTQIVLFYGSAQSTGFTYAGNGWYRIFCSPTGISAATNTGVQVKDKYTVYVTGFQMEESLARSPLCWGDLLGCAWTGTAHASTSTRTASRVRLPYSLFNIAETTIRVVWKAPVANILLANDVYFWSTDSVGLSAVFSASSDTFILNDAVNTAASSATTFVGGEIIILHFVLEPGSLKIYRAGTQIATASTYTPNTNPSYIYIGSEATPDYHTEGTFLDFTIFDKAMTAAEALADYTNIYRHTSGGDGFGVQLSPIPWLWTKDGDDVADNHNDSGEDNWIAMNGIPGSVPAVTTIEATTSSQFSTVDGLLWGLLTLPYHFDPYTYLGDDIDAGTADGGSSGGGYDGVSVTTADHIVTLTGEIGHRAMAMRSKQFCLVARMKESTSGSSIKLSARYAAGDQSYSSEYATFATATTFGLFLSPFISIPDIRRIDNRRNGVFYFAAGLSRPTGVSTQTVHIDYVWAMFRPFTQIILANAGTTTTLYYSGRGAWAVTSGTVRQMLPKYGDIIELVPGINNYLFSLIGATATDPVITYTLTYNKIEVTPRWLLI